MLLNDIGKSPNSTFKRINQHLESNYGFKISEDVSDKDLVMIIEKIEDEITELKIKGDDAKASPEISKRLLVLEGVRQLRESAAMRLQSTKYNSVINDLTKFVIDMYDITATEGNEIAAFENAVSRAMDEYRSSRYRFPDDEVELKVRNNAASEIQGSLDDEAGIQLGLGEEAWSVKSSIAAESVSDHDNVDTQWYLSGEVGEWLGEDLTGDWYDEIYDWNLFRGDAKQAIAVTQKYVSMVDPGSTVIAFRTVNGLPLDKAWQEYFDLTEWKIKRQALSADSQEMSNTKDLIMNIGNKQPALHEGKRVMKEQHNLVKNLRKLLETEVSQAEVMMAAKGFAQELQEMIEKIGRLQNEDLPPVTDQMRETYGMQSASAFQTQIYGALQSVMDSLYTAKAQVDDSVSNMATTGQFNAETDMDADMGMDAGADPTAMDGEMDADLDPEMDADLDNIGDEMGDDFGGAEAEEPLGRSMKAESVRRMEQKILEMQRLVSKARKLKESKHKRK